MTGLWLANGRRIDPLERSSGDVFVLDGVIVDPPASTAGWRQLDCSDAWVAPGFVDLHADLADPCLDGEAALRGGFTTVVHGPTPSLDSAVAVRDRLGRVTPNGPGVLLLPAATRGLAGEELADLGAFAALGVRAVGTGLYPPSDPRVLRGLFAYAAGFGLTVFVRAAEPALETGGLAREGPRAARAGLPGVPPASEVIGIARIGALARATGASVHATHCWTGEGVAALDAARAAGTRLTASTTAAHLALDDLSLLASGYAGSHRLVPPLGDPDDRAALAAALVSGRIAGVASDHRPLPAIAQEVELARAEPGMTAFLTAFPLVLSALGDPFAVVRALSTGPASVLGQTSGFTPGAPADLVVLDPAVKWRVGDRLGSQANSPLCGQVLTGAIRFTLCGGLVYPG